uniref:Uncharacterized protein n=1 Tax=Arundo donax TaxID=35708 RepID=A0A0A9DPK1_ARUDO
MQVNALAGGVQEDQHHGTYEKREWDVSSAYQLNTPWPCHYESGIRIQMMEFQGDQLLNLIGARHSFREIKVFQ